MDEELPLWDNLLLPSFLGIFEITCRVCRYIPVTEKFALILGLFLSIALSVISVSL